MQQVFLKDLNFYLLINDLCDFAFLIQNLH